MTLFYICQTSYVFFINGGGIFMISVIRFVPLYILTL